jgi:hypothetical protein
MVDKLFIDDMASDTSKMSPEDLLKYESGDVRRTSGGVICAVCQKEYRKHPQLIGAPWLNKICTGELVKL